ncbi:MAG: response regulator [Thermoguttaceae bacterium]
MRWETPLAGLPAAMITTDPSLLISDDDLNFRETLESVFAPRGFHILLAGDGEEAVHIVRTQVVHLALLDMHMPKLTGLETLRLVKQFKAMLPCILMSAHWDDLLLEQARLADAFLVLPKTVTLRQITGAVGQALERTYHWHDDTQANGE